jgi:hypothetical protein
LTFQNLAKLGLLQNVGSTKSNFSQISRNLKLINDYESSVERVDTSYAYAGYAPISLRLLEMAANSSVFGDTKTKSTVGLSWKGLEDTVKLLPGETVEKAIIPDTKLFKPERILH